MKILSDFFQILWLTFSGIFKGILGSLPSYYQIYDSLNQIKQTFSVQGVLQYGFGVPEIIFTVFSCLSLLAMIVKWMLKHKLV